MAQPSAKLGLIGGTGLYAVADLPGSYPVETPYGPIEVSTGTWDLPSGPISVCFVSRHGPDHSVPPHLVNYRGIVEALSRCGVTRIVGVHSVGSLKERVPPGSLFVASDFVDLTWRGGHTFFHKGVVHVDLSAPFCPDVRKALLASAALRASTHEGTYVCTQGPRLETPAEVRHLATLADVVGMTLCPEAALAREREICYASVGVVGNYAVGLRDAVTATGIAKAAAEGSETVLATIREAAAAWPKDRRCVCTRALEGARMGVVAPEGNGGKPARGRPAASGDAGGPNTKGIPPAPQKGAG